MEVLAQRTQDEVFESSVRAQLEVIEAALLKAEADSDMVTEARSTSSPPVESGSGHCWSYWAPISARTLTPTMW